MNNMKLKPEAGELKPIWLKLELPLENIPTVGNYNITKLKTSKAKYKLENIKFYIPNDNTQRKDN